MYHNLFSSIDESYQSVGWGRIFFPYGSYEHPSKLISSLAAGLLEDKKVSCNNSDLKRDYIHVEDVAEAFIILLENDFHGAVNIGSGKGIYLGQLAETIARKLGKEDLLTKNNYDKKSDQEIPEIIDDNSLLLSLGWKERNDIDRGIEEIIEVLKNERTK